MTLYCFRGRKRLRSVVPFVEIEADPLATSNIVSKSEVFNLGVSR
jgi:hypothetical protein